MTPVRGLAGPDGVFAWRLDEERFKGTWDSGEGAFLFGGRWNSAGNRTVYCSVDPATAILEVAVHKTFRVLDTVPHVLTGIRIADESAIHIVEPGAIPNANWLRPGIPNIGQQRFGDDVLEKHAFVLIPSAVSTHSWNLIFDPVLARDKYSLHLQEGFVLDTRLHPLK
ncbi:MAG TPA: RES domain-containing protein [Sphingomicrobium sp.]|nr:RES domain-containing protein [Sphingomicrobium sp.]